MTQHHDDPLKKLCAAQRLTGVQVSDEGVEVSEDAEGCSELSAAIERHFPTFPRLVSNCHVATV